MKRSLVIVLATALCLLALPATAAVIYQENFLGLGGPLNGTNVGPTAATWEAGPVFLDDGSVGTVVSGSPTGQAAHLPFAPQAGNIYTLSATITNTFPDWIAIGFMTGPAPGGSWTDTNANKRHSNSGAHVWMLNRNHPTANDQEGFNGPNTSNVAFPGGNLVDPTQPVAFRIELDTTAATWTAAYFINGVQQGATSNLPATANANIGGVGFSRTNNVTAGTGGVLRDFQLSVIPEPTTLTLAGLALGAAGLLRRRKW